MVLGFMVGLLALFSPGTGLLEIGALFALVLAGYSIANLPFHWWALGLLVVGFIPFLFSLRARQERPRWILLGLTLTAYIIGSAFLFSDSAGRPAVNLGLILLMSTLTIGMTWLLTRKSLEAYHSQPAFDLDRLIGKTGRVTSDLRPEGTVYVEGEEWTARSQEFISTGNIVRVLGRTDLTLQVEPVQKEAHTP
jgi:membrane-bound serine protease (ClpP class)